MTLSREKRTQRKKSRIYRLINRACRINLIKFFKRNLGDNSNLPVSRLKNDPESMRNDYFSANFSFPEYEQEIAAIVIEPEQEISAIDLEPAIQPAAEGQAAFAVSETLRPEQETPVLSEEHMVISRASIIEADDEDVVVTPYGTFSRYKQEELLDRYESSETDADQHSEIIVTNAREIITQVADRTAAVFAAAFAWTAMLFRVADCRICRGFIVFTAWAFSGMAHIGARIPEVYRRRLTAAGSGVNDALLRAMEALEIGLAKLDDRLMAAEEKALKILSSARRKAASIVRSALLKCYAQVKRISAGWQQVIEFTDRNRRKCAFASVSVLAVLTAAAMFIGSVSAYEYSYNGKVLGIVKNQNDVYVTVDVIGDKLAKAYDANIIISKEENIAFNRVYGLDLKIDSREEVLNSFTYLKDMEVKAAAIKVNGKQVAILDNKKSAESMLEAIQNKYIKTSDKIKYDEIGFAEDVQITEVGTKLGNLQDKEKILEYMMTGAVEKKIHVVKSGETFSGIASAYGIKQDQLKSSNPDTNPDRLQIGQELVLTASVPVVTVQTVETAEYTAAIPFVIEYENTEAKYKGEQSVKNKGVNGEKQVVAQITRNNGIEVTRTELSATVISEPVAQVVLVGTKKLPPLIGTGSFSTPVRGKITSRFGTRWGRMHEGVDFGAPTGTHVSAADGGTVTFAGWDGAYGNVIRINHGGGKTSVYAHLSKILVKKGTKVYKGQHIGNVGNTGRSTGPHLHFEIRVNGVPKNPLNYL